MTRTTTVLLALLFVLASACDDSGEGCPNEQECTDLADPEGFDLADRLVSFCVARECSGWQTRDGEFLTGCIQGCIGMREYWPTCDTETEALVDELFFAASERLCGTAEDIPACIGH